MSEENRSLQDIDENEARAILWARRIAHGTVELNSVDSLSTVEITFSYVDKLLNKKTLKIDWERKISFIDLQPVIEFRIDKQTFMQKEIFDFIKEISFRNLTLSIDYIPIKLSLEECEREVGPLTLNYPYARYLNCVMIPDENENIIVKLGIYVLKYCIINEIPFGIINYPEGRGLQIIDECFATAKDFVEFGAK